MSHLGSSAFRPLKPGKQHRRPRFSSIHNVKHLRTNGLSTGFIRRIRPPLGDPVCDEARGISRDPNTRQLPFLTNFQLPTGFQNLAEKLMPRAHCGARDAPAAVGGNALYMPCPLRPQEKFEENPAPRVTFRPNARFSCRKMSQRRDVTPPTGAGPATPSRRHTG
jgi:hypothetical protein